MRISDWSSDVCSSDLRSTRKPTRSAADHASPETSRKARPSSPTASYLAVGRRDEVSNRRMSQPRACEDRNRQRPRRNQPYRLAGVRRSEERRVGKACVSPCSSRRSRYHSKKNRIIEDKTTTHNKNRD